MKYLVTKTMPEEKYYQYVEADDEDHAIEVADDNNEWSGDDYIRCDVGYDYEVKKVN